MSEAHIESTHPIEIIGLGNRLGEKWVHRNLDLTVLKSEIIAIIGASGCGKTTLLRTILMLRQPTSGTIKLFGMDTGQCSQAQSMLIRQRWGVMFQSGALFGSLTVLENVMFPLAEFTSLSRHAQREIALLKIALVGLDEDAAIKYPAELSGGMRKRAAVARAIALDPELVFLDEPTAGLDPKSASELDELILQLRDNLGLTVVMATHDLDTLWQVPDRVVFLGEGKVLAAMGMKEMMKQQHPLIQSYFSNARSQLREQIGD